MTRASSARRFDGPIDTLPTRRCSNGYVTGPLAARRIAYARAAIALDEKRDRLRIPT